MRILKAYLQLGILFTDFTAQLLFPGTVGGQPSLECGALQQLLCRGGLHHGRHAARQTLRHLHLPHRGMQPHLLHQFQMLAEMLALHFLHLSQQITHTAGNDLIIREADFAQTVQFRHFIFFLLGLFQACPQHIQLHMSHLHLGAERIQRGQIGAFLLAHVPVVGLLVLLGNPFGDSGNTGDRDGKRGRNSTIREVLLQHALHLSGK